MKSCEITWDLESLYSSTKLWDEDFAKLEALAQEFAAYKGRLAESPAIFKAAIEASDTFDRLSEKLYTYAHLRSDENTSVGVNRARVDRICAKLAELSALDAWFEPEVMATPDERMKELLESDELAFYRRSIGSTNLFHARMKSENTKRSAPRAKRLLLWSIADRSIMLISVAYMHTPMRIIPSGADGAIFVKAVARRAPIHISSMARYPFAFPVSFLSCSTLRKYRPVK